MEVAGVGVGVVVVALTAAGGSGSGAGSIVVVVGVEVVAVVGHPYIYNSKVAYSRARLSSPSGWRRSQPTELLGAFCRRRLARRPVISRMPRQCEGIRAYESLGIKADRRSW